MLISETFITSLACSWIPLHRYCITINLMLFPELKSYEMSQPRLLAMR